jgi:hypothetical protein
MNEITAEITGINYKPLFKNDLPVIDIKNFNVNSCPASCLININNSNFAISKWVSPKRTRSYPFERIYNTLGYSKKITVIPVIKDEGAKGDRDFIQWDTISLMSLLDVYVILGYYDEAEINYRLKGKITNQKFNNKFVNAKISDISHYCSSALHWNLNEINKNLVSILNLTQKGYERISKTTNVKMHNIEGINRFKSTIMKNVNEFMLDSRRKAKEAQNREIKTIQPKESLSSFTKTKVTIKNYLGGNYYFTVDEIKKAKNKIYLIESKHSKNGLFPATSDIKDGLLKMILYCNLSSIRFNGKQLEHIPLLNLTSTKIKGSICSNDESRKIVDFFRKNFMENPQINFIQTLFNEANSNKYLISIGYMK